MGALSHTSELLTYSPFHILYVVGKTAHGFLLFLFTNSEKSDEKVDRSSGSGRARCWHCVGIGAGVQRRQLHRDHRRDGNDRPCRLRRQDHADREVVAVRELDRARPRRRIGGCPLGQCHRCGGLRSEQRMDDALVLLRQPGCQLRRRTGDVVHHRNPRSRRCRGRRVQCDDERRQFRRYGSDREASPSARHDQDHRRQGRGEQRQGTVRSHHRHRRPRSARLLTEDERYALESPRTHLCGGFFLLICGTVSIY